MQGLRQMQAFLDDSHKDVGADRNPHWGLDHVFRDHTECSQGAGLDRQFGLCDCRLGQEMPEL